MLLVDVRRECGRVYYHRSGPSAWLQDGPAAGPGPAESGVAARQRVQRRAAVVCQQVEERPDAAASERELRESTAGRHRQQFIRKQVGSRNNNIEIMNGRNGSF